MDAVLIAGGIPKPEDPLYEFTGGVNKALLDICGKPMIQWVLDALETAEKAGKLVIVGLERDSGLITSKVAEYLESQGDLLENVKAGILKILDINPAAERALIVSTDIPAITSDMVDWLVDEAESSTHDVYYNVITRQVMETRYPSSNRSYVKLKGLELCGGDMNVLNTRIVTGDEKLYGRIVEARKSAFKQASLIGFDNLLLYLLRAIDLEGAVRRVSKRLNLKGRAIVCPYAEIGMDVDKPHQLEILRADLSNPRVV
jgi:GTP:adenosylcobinamide-phosphate guanylyltransferase